MYPTCDVVVPHTKSMEDLFTVLNVIIKDDTISQGDFWRNQSIIPIPKSSDVRPQDHLDLMDPSALKEKHIAIPKCYVGKSRRSSSAATFSPATSPLWHRAISDLISLGATITETDSFPLVENYSKQHFPGQSANIPGIPDNWIATERCDMIATAWDDFLQHNNDANIPSLAGVNHTQINPGFAPMDDPAEFTEQQNHVRYAEMTDFIRHRRRPDSMHNLPGCAAALGALEAARKRDLEDWMDANGFDLLAFPTNGDVGRAAAEECREAMLDALREGVKYSNGDRAMKHLGVPAVTVPMGMLEDKGMPVGITFAGRAYADGGILRCAFAYEAATRRRLGPPLAPPLVTDVLVLAGAAAMGTEKLELVVEWKDVVETSDKGFEIRDISLGGTIQCEDSMVTVESIRAFVNGDEDAPVRLNGESWEWKARMRRPHVQEKYPVPEKITRDQFMVVLIAKASNNRATAILLLEN